MLPVCRHCQSRVWFPGHHWRCAPDLARIESWCAKVIRQTANTGRDPARYACLAHRVGGSHLATRQQVDPKHLLRRGWSAFVKTLYRSRDLKAFAQYKSSLDDFRQHFALPSPKAGVFCPELEPYRQLEFLQAVEERKSPKEPLYLDPDPEQDGYVLPGEKVIWRRHNVWHMGGFRIPWLIWLAAASIVWDGIRWLYGDWPDWIEDRIFSNLEGEISNIIEVLLGVVPGVIVAILVLSYFVDWSIGRLTLTNRALYFRGRFVSQYVALDGIHKLLDNKKGLVVMLPPEKYWKFWIGRCHARWLIRVMRSLADERRRETG